MPSASASRRSRSAFDGLRPLLRLGLVSSGKSQSRDSAASSQSLYPNLASPASRRTLSQFMRAIARLSGLNSSFRPGRKDRERL